MVTNRRLELLVGGFVLAGIIALLFLVFQVANVQSFGRQDSYILTAHFDNIGGLKVRSPVKVGGVTVGEVSKIALDADTYTPVVTLTISKKYGYFPETSSASILTAGLLGEQFIGIEPGFVDDDIYMLEDGALLEDTKSALVLEDMIGQVLYSLGNSEE